MAHATWNNKAWRAIAWRLLGIAFVLTCMFGQSACEVDGSSGKSVSDVTPGASSQNRAEVSGPLRIDQGGWYDIGIRDRAIARRLEEERRIAGFETGGLVQHKIGAFSPGPDVPEVLRKANQYFYEPGLKFSVDRLTAREMHLMTPAPVNAEWYKLLGIPYTSANMRKPPMLVYKVMPDLGGYRYKLLGVERVADEADPFFFARGWKESRNVMPLDEILKVFQRVH